MLQTSTGQGPCRPIPILFGVRTGPGRCVPDREKRLQTRLLKRHLSHADPVTRPLRHRLPNRQPPGSRHAWVVVGSVAAIILMIGVVAVVWRPWQHPQSNTTAISSSNAPTTSTPAPTAAAPPSAPTSAAPELPPPPSTVAAPPEGYFTDVRRVFSDWNHGQGMADTSGTNRVLTEVFDWVCQHQDADPNVVNQQIQMQETWFNHPSLELYEANRLRSIAMSYCSAPAPPPTTITATPAPTIVTPSATSPRTTSPAPAPEPVDPASWICDSIRGGTAPGKAMAAAQERFGMTQADAYLAYSNCA